MHIIKNVLIGSQNLFGIFHSDANINMMWHASDMILAWYNYIIDSYAGTEINFIDMEQIFAPSHKT